MNTAEEWVTAAEAVTMLKPVFRGSEYEAKLAICKRAHSGLINAQADTFIIDNKTRTNATILKEFWWAEGQQALEQNWPLGDFSTWIPLGVLAGNLHLGGGKIRARAFGVTFLRADVEKMLPPAPTVATPALIAPNRSKGGRPRADWSEDLWVEIARQLYVGDLKPKTAADIERAMHQWLISQGKSAGESTIRDRARLLWRAIQRDEN
jgi:hypothetical protein